MRPTTKEHPLKAIPSDLRRVLIHALTDRANEVNFVNKQRVFEQLHRVYPSDTAHMNSVLVVGGSRLYGANTPTSDYDLRGIYFPHVNRSLVPFGHSENSSCSFKYLMHDGGTDISIEAAMHPFDKFLDLSLRGNPNMLEIAQSYIAYGNIIDPNTNKDFHRLMKVLSTFYTPKTITGLMGMINRDTNDLDKLLQVLKTLNDNGVDLSVDSDSTVGKCVKRYCNILRNVTLIEEWVSDKSISIIGCVDGKRMETLQFVTDGNPYSKMLELLLPLQARIDAAIRQAKIQMNEEDAFPDVTYVTELAQHTYISMYKHAMELMLIEHEMCQLDREIAYYRSTLTGVPIECSVREMDLMRKISHLQECVRCETYRD